MWVEKEGGYGVKRNLGVRGDRVWVGVVGLVECIGVREGDEVVVGEIWVGREMEDECVWVKVGGEEERIGWIGEDEVLREIVGVEGI